MLQWQDPVCARKGCSNRLGLEYDHFEDWALTHTTRTTAAKRFCHADHALKTAGWLVSEPDVDGRCTFAPPPKPTARGRPLDTTTKSDVLDQLRDGIEHVKTNRHAAVANAPP